MTTTTIFFPPRLSTKSRSCFPVAKNCCHGYPLQGPVTWARDYNVSRKQTCVKKFSRIFLNATNSYTQVQKQSISFYFWKIGRDSFRYINGLLDYFYYFFRKSGEPVLGTSKIFPSKQNPYQTPKNTKKRLLDYFYYFFGKSGEPVLGTPTDYF